MNIINFKQFLNEKKEGKNLHLEHIEDGILNFGIDGARSAINYLRALRDLLSGNSDKKINITTKFDGAPAIVCGIDPEDNRFFVGTKSVFNKTPKLIKEESDLNKFEFKGQLKEKLIISLKYLPEIGIKNIVQGDLMFTNNDLKIENIEGKKHITFQPNTILYAVPSDTNLAKKILNSKIGIVFHTLYKGNSIENLTASFGVDISKFRNSKNVWYDDVYYKNVSGTALFTIDETKEITKILSKSGKLFNKIEKIDLNKFIEISDENKSLGFKTFWNDLVRVGKYPTNGAEYIQWFNENYNKKVISKLKTDKKKQEKLEFKNEKIKELQKLENHITNVINFQKLIIEAKKMIIDKLNSGMGEKLKTFIKTNKGFKVTDSEGFVAIDTFGKNGVKLVDRMEFSKQNFNAVKNWS